MKNFQEQDLFGGQKKSKEEKKPEDNQLDLGLDFSEKTKAEAPVHKLFPKKKETSHKKTENNTTNTINLPEEMPPHTQNNVSKQNPEKKDDSHNPPEKNAEKKEQSGNDTNQPEKHQKKDERVINQSKTLHELKELAKSQKLNQQPHPTEIESKKKESHQTAETNLKQDSVTLQNQQKERVILSNPTKKNTSVGSQPAISQHLKNTSSLAQQQVRKNIPKHIAVSEGASIGHILQEARSKIGLSQDQVAIQTKIKKAYIEALERDDFEHLPSMVYVKAYIRRLCQEYGIDEIVAEKAIKSHGKENPNSVPDDVLIELEKSKQVNIEKQKRLKIFQIIVTSSVIIIIIAAIITIYSFTRKPSAEIKESKKEVPVLTNSSETMDTKDMDRIMKEILFTYPTGNLTELEPPKK